MNVTVVIVFTIVNMCIYDYWSLIAQVKDLILQIAESDFVLQRISDVHLFHESIYSPILS